MASGGSTAAEPPLMNGRSLGLAAIVRLFRSGDSVISREGDIQIMSCKLSSRFMLHRVLLVMLLSCFCQHPINGQGRGGQEKTVDYYNGVLDVLFPRDELDSESVEFALIARYKPPFDPESQLTLTKTWDGKWNLIRYHSESGNIFYKLDEIVDKTGHTEVNWLAKQITVRRTKVPLQESQLENLHRNFIDQVISELDLEKQYTKSQPETTVVISDATQYKAWYKGSSLRIEYENNGSGIGRPKEKYDTYVITWLKKLWQVANSDAAKGQHRSASQR